MLRLLIVSAVLLAAAVIAAAQAPTPPPRTITVSETAERMFSPDLALVVLAVQTQADTLGRATEQNNAITTHATDAVRKLNIPNLTLRTLSFDVQPVYEQPAPGRPQPSPPRIVGYQVVNRIEARIPDTDAARLSANVGRVIDAALGAGLNRVDNIQFGLQDTSAAQRMVLADATQHARATAAAMATAANVALGPLMTLSATPYYTPPMPLYARAEAAAAPGVPIMAGELTVRATVTAVYGIQ